jgi:hypothetical protein
MVAPRRKNRIPRAVDLIQSNKPQLGDFLKTRLHVAICDGMVSKTPHPHLRRVTDQAPLIIRLCEENDPHTKAPVGKPPDFAVLWSLRLNGADPRHCGS